MAGDSSPQDQAKQAAHAERIRFERQMSRMTGLTPRQVRQQLRQAQSLFVNRTLDRVDQQNQAPARPPTIPKIVSESKSVAPPLEVGSKKTNNDQVGGGASTRVTFNIIANGARALADFDAINIRPVDA